MLPNKVYTSHSCTYRLFLGLSDASVETVFRTTDGFTTSWARWSSTEPTGYAGLPSGPEDCAGRSPNGLWADFDVTRNYHFYCEGKNIIISSETTCNYYICYTHEAEQLAGLFFVRVLAAPHIYLNGNEITSDKLIDNNSTTCIQMSDGDGCNVHKVNNLWMGFQSSAWRKQPF